jgi:MSHA biogenesis protein MshO
MRHEMRLDAMTTGPQRGFTLIEMVVAIVITGIVAGIVAVFIKLPVQGYVSAARRAELTDIADTAVRRVTRDLRLAVPRSVRVTQVGGVYYLEFLQSKTGAYYRAQCSTEPCPVADDILDFAVADTGFDVLGGFPAAPAPQPVAGDRVVIYNLGVTGSDAYAASNTAVIASVTGRAVLPRVTLNPAMQFPFESPSQNFQVIDTPVTYVCDPGVAGVNGTGTLRRHWGYTITAAQATPPAGGNSALLATQVSSCLITEPENLSFPGYALVTLRLKLKAESEEVTFYHEVHINNVP